MQLQRFELVGVVFLQRHVWLPGLECSMFLGLFRVRHEPDYIHLALAWFANRIKMLIFSEYHAIENNKAPVLVHSLPLNAVTTFF